MAAVATFAVLSDNDSVASDLPNMSVSKSVPFIQRHMKAKSLSTDYQSKNIINNLQSLPLNILLSASNNTKFSLQLTELIETPNNKNNNNSQKTPPTPGKNVTFKFNKADQDHYEHKKKEDKNYRLGDLVIIGKNKQGLIRYIGELHGDTHIWYGIELIGGHKGFHGGTFQGQRYFVCGIHQGMFVKKHQILRKMCFTDFNASPHTPKTPKTRPKTPKTPKKLGPRDIGKIKGWKPSRDIYKTDSELKQQELRKKYKAQTKKRGSRKRSSLTDIESELSNILEKKPGPRDIGRVHSKNTDWKPIADADKIIQEQRNMKASFLGSKVFKSNAQRRNRASSALFMRESGTSGHGRAHKNKTKISSFRKDKEKKKSRLNKSTGVSGGLLSLDPPITRQRSKTPDPSTTGLRYVDSDEKAMDGDKKSSKRRKKKRNNIKHQANYSEDNSAILPIDCTDEVQRTRSKSRSKSRNQKGKNNRNKNKIRKAKKYKLALGRSRSHTMDPGKVRLTLSKANSAGSGKCELDFPDILKFDDEPIGRGRLLGGNRKKRKKKLKRTRHQISHSTGNTCSEKEKGKAVIIRVSSEDVEEKRGHRKKGLNMSRTGIDDELLFAEVNAEIEQRKSGILDIEQQLNALQNTDFDMEFEKALEEANQNQNQFKQSNSKIIEVLESDFEELSENSHRKMNNMKGKGGILWVDNENDSDGDKDNEVNGYVE